MSDHPQQTLYPQRIVDIYSQPMWESFDQGCFIIQSCSDCGATRYPPAPNCPSCLSMNSEWVQPSSKGTILSWVIFHRQYLDSYPAPYNVVAVQLEEGPIIISNLFGEAPEGSWIGKLVEIIIEHDAQGVGLPKVRFV